MASNMNTWTNSTGDNLWDNPENWSGVCVPSNDGVTIDSSSDGYSISVIKNTSVTEDYIEVGQNAGLSIFSNEDGKDFSVTSMIIDSGGNLLINTASAVSVTDGLTLNGNMTIKNSASFSGNINGSGNVNLINSVMGSSDNFLAIDGSVSLTLQDSSVLYADLSKNTGQITFDPSTKNSLYINSDEGLISTRIIGFSENSVICNNEASGVTMTNTNMSQNADGTWDLKITFSDNHVVEFSDIQLASGFNPASINIVNNSDNDTQYLNFTNENTSSYTMSSDMKSVNQAMDSVYTKYAYDDNANIFLNENNNNQWSDPDNWSKGVVPSSDDTYDTIITGRQNVTIPADVSDIGSLTINDNSTVNLSSTTFISNLNLSGENSAFNVATGSSLTADQITLSNDTTLNIAGTLNVSGNNIAGDGTINLDGATLGSDQSPVNTNANNVTMNNSSVAYIAQGASGNISVSPGSVDTIYFQDNSSGSVTYNMDIEGATANTVFGLEASSVNTPQSATWTQASDNSWSLQVGMKNGSVMTINGIHFYDGNTPTSSYTIKQNSDKSWSLSDTSSNIYYWNGPSTDGDPEDPANWTCNGSVATKAPDSNDTVYFNNGQNVVLKPGVQVHWGSVQITNGSNLSITTGNSSVSGMVLISSSSGNYQASNLFITATSGTVTLGEPHNRGNIISSVPLVIHTLDNYYNGTIIAQKGLTITKKIDINQSPVEVWGPVTLGSNTYNTTAGVESDKMYHSNTLSKYGQTFEGSIIVHDSNDTCFSESTVFNIVAGKYNQTIQCNVARLTYGDKLLEGGTVKWMGRKKVRKNKAMIRLGNLVVTPDHLILQDNVLVPAQECRGAKEVFTDREQYVYHIQTEKHQIVYANGVPSDTLMFDPSREPMETVFGQMNRDTARWGMNTAAPLRTLR